MFVAAALFVLLGWAASNRPASDDRLAEFFEGTASWIRTLGWLGYTTAALGALVLLIAAVFIWAPVMLLLADPRLGRIADALFLPLWVVFIWVYLTAIKRSRFRTIGYRLTGIKIVTTSGGRPTLSYDGVPPATGTRRVVDR